MWSQSGVYFQKGINQRCGPCKAKILFLDLTVTLRLAVWQKKDGEEKGEGKEAKGMVKKPKEKKGKNKKQKKGNGRKGERKKGEGRKGKGREETKGNVG